MPRLKSERLRVRRDSWSRVPIAQISLSLNGRFYPTSLSLSRAEIVEASMSISCAVEGLKVCAKVPGQPIAVIDSGGKRSLRS